jgi:potassium-dependent mechanosensitive channel
VKGRFPIAAFLAAVLLLLTGLVPALAYDEVKLRDAERMATLLQAQLRGVANRLNNGTLLDEALAAQRPLLEKLRAAAKTGSENASGPLSEIKIQVDGLGPAPASGDQEIDVLATQRKELNTQLARATAAAKQFTLVGLEAEQALSRLTSLQRGLFLQRVFKADKSVLNPTLWSSTIEGASILLQRLGNQSAQGMLEAEGRTNYIGLMFLPVGLLSLGILFFRVMPNILSRVGFGSAPYAEEPADGLQKLWHVIWSFTKYILAIVVVFFLVMATLDVVGLLTPPIENLLQIFIKALRPAFIYTGLIYFVASPRNSFWRLVAIDSAAARTLVVLIFIAYLIYGFGDQISNFASSINLPVSFAVGQSAFSALALIILIAVGLSMVRQQAIKGLAGQGTTYFLVWFMNFMPLWWILLLVAALALLFGFIALSYFIAGNLLDTAILAVAMGVLHAFIDALAAALLDPLSSPGRIMRRFTQWSEQGIQRFVLILRTLADATLVIVAVLALIALWTVVLFDVPGFLGSLGQGFRIGNISLSPKAIAIAFGIFGVGITITRYFSYWLERRVLSETHLDKGVTDSLRAATGYAGYSLAAAFALTAAGLDFSSLALVAGALGVGIGFGLQSIVNNFVSGLILLAERPVRVGDWVVTNAGEGIVKKINVRSTEIETFDNCTIIVPNSNLISEAVRNWTHRDSVGRFGINMTFTHGIDAEAMSKQLMTILQSHPKVMRHPQPLVQLSKITTQGLEFDMRGHIQDVFEAAQVTSDLRMEIAKLLPKDSLSSTLPPAKPPEIMSTAKASKK